MRNRIVAGALAVLLAAAVVSLHRVLAEARAAHDREDRELHRAEKRWLERERGQQVPHASGADGRPDRAD